MKKTCKSIFRRTLSFVVTAAMCLSLLPAAVFAGDVPYGNDPTNMVEEQFEDSKDGEEPGESELTEDEGKPDSDEAEDETQDPAENVGDSEIQQPETSEDGDEEDQSDESAEGTGEGEAGTEPAEGEGNEDKTDSEKEPSEDSEGEEKEEPADHVHNEDGWHCVWSECPHDHGPECYVPGEDGEDVLNCTHVCGEECLANGEGTWNCTPPEETEENQEPVQEEIPAEVKAFLDAVAAIPEITPENAVEVSEYVYGPVSEAYEALLGTEYEEREDVQEAAAVYAAAIEAVDAALNLESVTLATPGQTITAGSITKYVGDSGFYQRLPRSTNVCPSTGIVLSEYIPDDYENLTAEATDESLLDNADYAWGKFKESGYYYGMQCLQFNYDCVKPGSTTITLGFDYGFYYNSESGWGSCGHRHTVPGNWNTYHDTINFTVNVVTDYTVTYVDGGDKVTGMPDPRIKTVGTSVASTTRTFTAAPAPSRENYEFTGWLFTGDNKVYQAGDTVTMEWEESDGRNVLENMIAQWREIDPIIPTTYTVTYTDGVSGKLVFPDQGYEGLKEGDKTPAFAGGDPTSYTDDDGNTYTFMGWDPTVNPVVSADDADEDGNIIYTATWKKDFNDDKVKVTKSSSEAEPTVGKEFTYTIHVENQNSEPVTVTITDVLSSKLDYVSSSDGGEYDKDTRTVTWTNVNVPANGSKDVTVTVKANTSGTIENEAVAHWSNTSTNGKTTVTAKDEYTYKLTYHENTGSDEKDKLVSGMPSPNPESSGSITATSYPFTVSSTEPTREGYTFKGWNTQADGSGTNYAAGATLTADTTNKDLHLYAQWKPNDTTYTVNHVYYTNDNTEPDGTFSETVSNVKVGDKVNAKNIEPEKTYKGNDYEYDSATPEEITLDVDISKNVITLTYKRNVSSYTVVHEYYTNDNSEPDGTVRESVSSVKVGTVIKPEDLKKETYEKDGVENTYTFTSSDPETGLTVDKSGNQIITLRYNRTVTSAYKVVHEYYTNGTKDGETEITISNVPVGTEVKAAEINQVNTYERDGVINTYTFDSADKETFILDASGTQIITLRYSRTVRTPSPDPDPTPTPDPDPDPTPDPDPDPDPDPTPTPARRITVNTPDNPTPLTEVAETPVPLSDTIDIFDDDVPLAGGVNTGNNDAIWYLLAALSLAGLGLVKLLEKKSKTK